MIYFLVGCLLLVMLVVGATYAYFTAKASDDNTVKGDAATVSFGLSVDKVTTIDIQETGLSSVTPPIKYTLNQEEIYTIFSIIDNLTFSKETCDGIPTYFIKYNSKEKEGFLTYGIEKFENEYHITSDEKGEAILSNEQQKQLDKIINKMYN